MRYKIKAKSKNVNDSIPVCELITSHPSHVKIFIKALDKTTESLYSHYAEIYKSNKRKWERIYPGGD